MKKLATLSAAAALVLGLASPALAGGTSGTSFSGSHWCIVVFAGPNNFFDQTSAPPTRSATWSWPPGCRSFSGAAFLTTR